MTRVVAIDQGTTSTRALTLGTDGLTPILSLPHDQQTPAPGHVEQDAEELLANILRCLQASGAQVVGLSNQGESCLAWDARTGQPISPVISWQDDRTADVTTALERDGAAPMVMERAGLPLDPYFSASKLGWILRHIPAAAELARSGHLRLGTTDAFFRDRLTGRYETDIATASRTSLLNLATGEWDADLCRLFGVPIEALPRITPTSGNLGTLPGGAHLAASIVDQQAALYGHGCRTPGQTKITFGTGAFAQCVTGRLVRPQTGILPTIAWQEDGSSVTYALDGGVYAAASAVNWARELGLFTDYTQISAFDGVAIDRGLAFVPALVGLGAPHWNRAARGAWLGLALADGPRDLMQALLEGIALRAVEVLDAMATTQATDGPVSVDGGLSRNPYFTAFLAQTLGRDLFLSDEAELTAMGLAHMAAKAAGVPVVNHRPGQIVAAGPDRPGPARLAQFAMARLAIETYGTPPTAHR
jgi:glycerol kinase